MTEADIPMEWRRAFAGHIAARMRAIADSYRPRIAAATDINVKRALNSLCMAAVDAAPFDPSPDPSWPQPMRDYFEALARELHRQWIDNEGRPARTR